MVDRYRNYQPRRRPPVRQKKSHRGFYIFLLAIFLIFGGKSVIGKMQADKDKPQTKSSTVPKPKKTVNAEPISNTTWDSLSQKVNAIISEQPGLDISVAVIDISSNTKANYGVQEAFHGASTTKVLTATAYLHDVETGKVLWRRT